MDATLEVRIDAEAKEAARQRGEAHPCVAFLPSGSRSPETSFTCLSSRTEDPRRPPEEATARSGASAAGSGRKARHPQGFHLQLGEQSHMLLPSLRAQDHRFPQLRAPLYHTTDPGGKDTDSSSTLGPEPGGAGPAAGRGSEYVGTVGEGRGKAFRKPLGQPECVPHPPSLGRLTKPIPT